MGPTSLGTTPTVVMTAPSPIFGFTYVYALTVTNAWDCTATDTHPLEITEDPEAGAVTCPRDFCANDMISHICHVTGNNMPGTWSLVVGAPDVAINPATGAIMVVNPNISVPTPVVVNYTVTNACGTDVATCRFTVFPAPQFSISGPTDVCSGDNYTLGVSFTPPYSSSTSTHSYLWSTGATTPTITDVQYDLVSMVYNVTVTNKWGCSHKESKVVNINPKPRPTINCPQRKCEGEMFEVTGNPGPGYLGGTWTASGVISIVSSTPTAVTIVGTPVGTGILTYTVTDPAPPYCTGAAYCYITVFPKPEPIVGPSTVCEGSTITLSDPSPGGAWESGNTSVATVDPSGVVTGVSGGTATISYVFPGGCAATHTVTVTGRATACVTWGWSTACSCWAFTFTGTPSAVVEYEVTDEHLGYGIWSTNTVTVTMPSPGVGSMATLEIPYASMPGNTVMVCVLNIKVGDCEWECDCPSGGCCAHANLGAKPANTQPELGAVAQIAPTSSLQIQPNPNTGTFKLSGHLQVTNLKVVTIEVVDMLGKTLLTETVPVRNGSIESNIAMREVANGVYMLKIKGEHVNHVLRCVIDK